MAHEHEPQDETVLLVERDPRVSRTTARLLRLLGYRVTEAADVAAALLLLREPADVTLLLTGSPELVPLARALRPGLPVVLTGGFAGADALAGLPAGAARPAEPHPPGDPGRAGRQGPRPPEGGPPPPPAPPPPPHLGVPPG